MCTLVNRSKPHFQALRPTSYVMSCVILLCLILLLLIALLCSCIDSLLCWQEIDKGYTLKSKDLNCLLGFTVIRLKEKVIVIT